MYVSNTGLNSNLKSFEKCSITCIWILIIKPVFLHTDHKNGVMLKDLIEPFIEYWVSDQNYDWDVYSPKNLMDKAGVYCQQG